MAKVKRALVSVSDKSGVVELGMALASMGVEVLSTGGTARALREAGVPVKDVSEHTGFPEMMDGRVKTLHPKIHGGLLARRDNEKDMREAEANAIGMIDMVVVNLYPFEQTISREGVSLEEAIENIDIGGPTMLRSASKNFRDVIVVVDPGDYGPVLEELKRDGDLSFDSRARLARKVFRHTSRYDTLIAGYLDGVVEDEEIFPDALTLTFKLGSVLRYGENPHQRAAFYHERADGGLSLAEAALRQGKEMSFNNYCDAHSALMLAIELDPRKAACAIIKHNNPCGAALAETPAEAYLKALRTDPVSAFGGVLAFNSLVDGEAASEIVKIFVEVVIAPGYTEDALRVFSEKQNIRVLEMAGMRKPLKGWDMKKIAGGLLIQEWDRAKADVMALGAVTRRQPTAGEREALAFACSVVKHVKSNAIVYAARDRTLGIGIGQTSRVQAARAGAANALEPLRGAVAASDGFFPFRDGVDAMHEMGVTAVVQPGGSLKDEEVIKAADEHGMAMLMTGTRHFRH
jgi:phosphoribosylaminoimidazolecarboxamide formyltransferase/IMP cyclohydrolase